MAGSGHLGNLAKPGIKISSFKGWMSCDVFLMWQLYLLLTPKSISPIHVSIVQHLLSQTRSEIQDGHIKPSL